MKTEPNNLELLSTIRARVRIRLESDCWEWLKCRDRDGYGSTGRGSAHRLAWSLVNGPIPNGLCCLHSCDNPRCCNPAHLFLGTHADNVADKVRKN